jgi:hypothetical protein
MAGYSGTPLPKKLGLKPAARFGLVKPPADFARALGALPDGVIARTVSPGTSRFDVIVCFAPTMAEVVRLIPSLKQRLDPAGGLWMAWPKRTKRPTKKPTTKSAVKTGAAATDVNENDVRAAGLAAGLVDNKVCAIDDVWSGLRFVFRLVDRPKGASR